MSAAPARRVGLLVPSSNTMMEVDFSRGLPPGTTLHSDRMYLADTTEAAEDVMLDEHVLPAARDLGTAHPDVAVFGCTSAGALRGDAYEAELCAEISTLVGAPVVSTIRSVRDAILAAQASRVALITPYIDELNRKVRLSLESAGINVVQVSGMGITDNFSIATVPAEEICNFTVKHLAGMTADLVFVSCTNFAGMAARSQLSERLEVPVLTSNQVVLEATINLLDRRLAQPQMVPNSPWSP
jgi:maleate isomerase